MPRAHASKTRRSITVVVVAAAIVAGVFTAPQASATTSSPNAGTLPGSDTFAFTSRMVDRHGGTTLDQLSVAIGPRRISSTAALVDHNLGRACAGGVWVLALNRTTLAVRSNTIRPLCTAADVSALTELVGGYTANTLVVVNSLLDERGNRPASKGPLDLGDMLRKVGGPAGEFTSVDLAQQTFSILGVPRARAGSAQFSAAQAGDPTTTGTGRAALQGRLVPDDSNGGEGRYSLVHLDYATYDISTAGAVTINGQVRGNGAPAGFRGGYHVLVADRRTLATITDTYYDTHAGVLNQIRMERDLVALADTQKQTVIVFLATIGDPTPPRALPSTTHLGTGCALDKLPFAETCTLGTTRTEQVFDVPSDTVDGIHPSLDITLQGASGGNNRTAVGGRGARFGVTMPVGDNAVIKPGTKLFVEVGQVGGVDSRCPDFDGPGWNGGGLGGTDCVDGGAGANGGGATDIRTVSRGEKNGYDSLSSRFLVAAGGGGAGGVGANGGRPAAGGNGGDAGAAGANGAVGYGAFPNLGGTPGTQSAGGGALGGYGRGGTGSQPYHDDFSGRLNTGGSGGGGGGLWGGGGGYASDNQETGLYGGAGGGGGSSLVPAGTEISLTHDAPVAVITFLTSYGPSMSDVLARFGATPTLVGRISASSPRYALVGSPNPDTTLTRPNPFATAEASPLRTATSTPAGQRPTGELQGVLARGNKSMRYEPVVSHPVAPRIVDGHSQGTDAVTTGVFDLVAGRRTGACSSPGVCPAPGTPYPFTPAAGASTAETNALTALERQLCPQTPPDAKAACESDPVDIRSTYASGRTTTESSEVARLTPPADPVGYDIVTYERVKAQILRELGDATTVGDQFAMVSNFLEGAARDLRTAGADVIRAVAGAAPDSSAPALTGRPLDPTDYQRDLVADVLPAGGAAATRAMAAFLAGVLDVSAQAVPASSSSEQARPSGWEAEARDLVEEARDQLIFALQRSKQLHGLLVGDWGTLAEYATNVRSDPAHWDVSPDDPLALERRLTSATTLSLYRQIVPLRFDAAAKTDDNDLGSRPTVCFTRQAEPTASCKKEFRTLYSVATNPVPPGGQVADKRFVAVAAPSGTDRSGTPIGSGLLTTLSGLGLIRSDLYLRWPFARTSRLYLYHLVLHPGRRKHA